MWLFLKENSKLVIKKYPLHKVEIGDIILYQEDKKLICHRLVKKRKSKDEFLLYVRGDSSTSLPSTVKEESYIGKAISRCSSVGRAGLS